MIDYQGVLEKIRQDLTQIEDIGEVAMTLINLRYKQAQDGIKKLLG